MNSDSDFNHASTAAVLDLLYYLISGRHSVEMPHPTVSLLAIALFIDPLNDLCI